MLEDKLLVWKCGRGSDKALEVVYRKYSGDMLRLGYVLAGDTAAAEDAVHDVFVAFARRAGKLRLRTGLKAYLLTSVANRLRSVKRTAAARVAQIDHLQSLDSHTAGPDKAVMLAEQSDRVEHAMQSLPCEQREVIVLHIHSGMKFREIAEASGVSLSTVQSRYNYGLNKLRSALDGEVEK